MGLLSRLFSRKKTGFPEDISGGLGQDVGGEPLVPASGEGPPSGQDPGGALATEAEERPATGEDLGLREDPASDAAESGPASESPPPDGDSGPEAGESAPAGTGGEGPGPDVPQDDPSLWEVPPELLDMASRGQDPVPGEPPGEERRAPSEEDLLSDIDSLLEPGDGGRRPFDEDSLLEDIGNLLDSGGEGSPRCASGLDTPSADDLNVPDGPGSWPERPDDETELGRLRRLLIDREMAQLSYMSSVLTEPGNHAQALSQVITEAILLRSRKDDKLNTVLGPTVEKIVSASVRRNPETLANNIFPVIGPAIRRSISETFSSMLQNFNSTLEMSLSLQGLKWRLEALRVRKPFSEIVLLHTLLYHVEEIYLIHAESGIVLDHLVSEGGESRDSDLVAGMFTAIQEFIKDSFSTGRGENLDNLRFGERAIFLRRADPVYMACVVRGNPPASLAQDLQQALELVVVDCAEDLENFDGNTEAFKKCRRYFEDFLTVRYQDASKKLPWLMRVLPLAVAILVALALVSSFLSGRSERRFQDLLGGVESRLEEGRRRIAEADRRHFERGLDLLRQEPGLVVTHVGPAEDGRLGVVVLHDNLARDPTEILAGEGRLDPGRFTVTSRPYVSLDEAIVDQRLGNAIKPLPTVKMDFNGQTGLLSLSGSAPMGWILATREKALTIPGVQQLDTSMLTDPRTMEMESLVSAINGVVIHFPVNKDEPIAEDAPALSRAVENIVTLEKLASEMQMTLSLIIYGHADATGQDRRNFELSEQRTKTVAAMLYARGSSIPIANYGLGSQFSAKSETGPPVEDQDSRKIELRVRLSQAGFGPSENP